MISIISMICVMAGTTLLGRTGDMFPLLRENGRQLIEPTVDVRERAERGSIPLSPRHLISIGRMTMPSRRQIEPFLLVISDRDRGTL